MFLVDISCPPYLCSSLFGIKHLYLDVRKRSLNQFKNFSLLAKSGCFPFSESNIVFYSLAVHRGTLWLGQGKQAIRQTKRPSPFLLSK